MSFSACLKINIFRTKQRICVAKEEKFENETLLCETAEDSGIWEGSLDNKFYFDYNRSIILVRINDYYKNVNYINSKVRSSGYQYELTPCSNPACVTGRPAAETTMKDVEQNLKNSKIDFDDRNFLSRYAEYVTAFGAEINAGGSTDGYGIWRMVKADADKIISNKNSRASDVSARSQNDSFTKNF